MDSGNVYYEGSTVRSPVQVVDVCSSIGCSMLNVRGTGGPSEDQAQKGRVRTRKKDVGEDVGLIKYGVGYRCVSFCSVYRLQVPKLLGNKSN